MDIRSCLVMTEVKHLRQLINPTPMGTGMANGSIHCVTATGLRVMMAAAILLMIMVNIGLKRIRRR